MIRKMLRNLTDIQNIMQDRRLPLALAALFILLALFSVISLGRMLFVSFDSVHVSLKSEHVFIEKIPPIASWHLFGSYEDAQLPTTQLDLTLQGVFVAGEGESQALISVGSGSGSLYGIGDTVPGGAKIDKILPERVILRHNGKLETLPILRPKLQLAPGPQDLF
ncbi:MAG: hypothetical protein KAS93_03320 [Gammaproteobacteria bacterium]|nr:hypothetical protein [Gammaproteobacteria bacterium]